MSAKDDFYDAFQAREFERAAGVLDANPDLQYLREMLYRVWSYSRGATMEQMGLPKKGEGWDGDKKA